MVNSTISSRPSKARRLALVLGSGGVRSVAALGIAEILASEGMKPDLLVGCSSGAIFAASIAMGLSSTESLALATVSGPPTSRKRSVGRPTRNSLHPSCSAAPSSAQAAGV